MTDCLMYIDYRPRGGGGGEGRERSGVLGYFHTYVGSGHFFGFKILNFNIFGVFRKMNNFFGYADFVNNLFESSQIGQYLWVISMHFRVFS